MSKISSIYDIKDGGRFECRNECEYFYNNKIERIFNFIANHKSTLYGSTSIKNIPSGYFACLLHILLRRHIRFPGR